MRENLVAGGMLLRWGRARGRGGAGRPGRGGRLKGTVPAAVTLWRLPGRGAAGSATSLRTTTVHPPTRTTASSLSTVPSASRGVPSTVDPLVESRSSRRRPSFSRVAVAWSQEALGESVVRSARGERPMLTGSPGAGAQWPCVPVPPRTVRVQPSRGSSACGRLEPMVLPSMRVRDSRGASSS